MSAASSAVAAAPSGTRVPFSFPFHPPALALPLTRADYLTHRLTERQKETWLGGTVKIAAALFAAGSLWQLFRTRRAERPVAASHTAPSPPAPAVHVAAAADSDDAAAASYAGADVGDLPGGTFASPSRRSTLAASTATLSALRRRTRGSVAPGGHAAGSAAAAQQSKESPRLPSGPPYTVGLVTPRSLERYGVLLQGGFLEQLQRERDVVAKVELLLPGVEESHAAFSARVRAMQLDVLLIQYHGADVEDVVAFLDYGAASQRLLLLHRPEEILERHAQHVFKRDQFNILQLLREVDVSVVLGESARPCVLKALPPECADTVCVVPHGFSGLDASAVQQARKLSPTTVVGALTNWNDMRWLADMLQLHSTVRARAPKAHIVLYAAGRFVPYTDARTKLPVDQLSELVARFPDRLAVVQREAFENASQDVQALKARLWQLSEAGRKIVLCNDGALFDSPVHADVFDFAMQLYREHLKDGAPKVEYSGALHARPGASIPIVFESPAMADVEIEGMQLIQVPYSQGACCSDSPGFPDCCPWYAKREHCPDFGPAVEAILAYIAKPQHYQSHRQNTFAAAKELTMRHVAAQYASIVRSINGM